jgi:hypothetical protein
VGGLVSVSVEWGNGLFSASYLLERFVFADELVDHRGVKRDELFEVCAVRA